MESSRGDSAESDAVSVKQEPRNDNIITVLHVNPDALIECMEFAEEKPVISGIFENNANFEVKQENTGDLPPAGTQDFVFVACADNVAKNEMREGQNANTSVRNSSVPVQDRAEKPCPYCGKLFLALSPHKTTCEMKFVYPCILCPTVVSRHYSIKRHVEAKHSGELSGFSVDEICDEIVDKRVELDVETAAEKVKVISELMTNARLRLQINCRPVGMESVSQDSNVSNVIEVPSTSKTSTVVGSVDKQMSTVPHQSVTRNTEATMESVDCNECDYQTGNKSHLHAHLLTNHSAQLDLISFDCPKCRKNFASHDQLKAHKNACSVKIFYTCWFCPKILMVKANVVSHIQDRHAVEVADKSTIEIADLVEANKKIVDLNYSNVAREKLSGQKAVRETVKVRIFNDSSGSGVVVVDSDAQQKSSVPDVTIVSNKKREVGSGVFVDSDAQQKSSVPDVTIVSNKKREVNVGNQSAVAKKAEHRQPKYMFCDLCIYKSTTKELLRKHIMNYHCETLRLKSGNCRHCEKNFTCQYDLKIHEANCSIRMYFSCLFCTKILLLKTNIVKHLLQKHSNEVKKSGNGGVDSLVEAGKRIVDTAIIETQKESTKNVNTEKKSMEIIDVEEKGTHFMCIDTQEEKTKITNTKKKSTRIIDTQRKTKKPSIKNINTEKKSAETIDVEKECTDAIDTQEKKTKVTSDTKKKSTQIINSRSKPAKPKIQNYICDHCSYKTPRKDHLIDHIRRKHSVELNLTPNGKDRFNFQCPFCPNAPYSRMDYVKQHVSRKHKSELANRTFDEIAQEILSNRAKVVDPLQKDPDKIDASTLEYVLVYCDKCKNLKTTPGALKSRKNKCRDCASRIIYVCSKCKTSHALHYAEFRKHWQQCTEMNDISQDYLDKLAIHRCSQCQFSSTHKFKLTTHLARTKHNAAKSVGEGKNEQTADDLELYDEAKFAVRPCVVDYPTMTNRYCSKCDKVVTEEMQPRRPTAVGLVCQVCKTRFHAQCAKCSFRINNWPSMRYHLNSKCFSGDYLCIKCPQRTTCWQNMQKHYLFRHTNRREKFLCEFCSFRSIHRTNFKVHLKKMHPGQTQHIVLNPKLDVDYACDLCSFTSKHKYCVKKHLQTVHGAKKHQCKLCKFKTRYEPSLRRHVVTRHQNHY